jgi:putative ABC transport system permease protein
MYMNLLSLPERLGPVLTLVLGVACAVGVLVAMLAMGVGARRQAMSDVRADRVILMSIGAPDPMQSSVPRDQATLIHDLPGIRQGPDHRAIAVSQVFVRMEARNRIDGKRVRFPLVGVTSGLTDLVPELRLTSGRMFRPGLNELIANDMCARQFSDFQIGDKRAIQGNEWLVVGHFAQGHAEGACRTYADAGSVLSAFKRDSYNQVAVMLQSAAGYGDFLSAVKANPTLRVEAKHESTVVEQEFKQFNRILNFASYFVGTIMALGATLGAANSLYAIVDGRRRELATLRAFGFGSGPIVASILVESALLVIPGALLGVGLAWILFNGLSASPFGFTFHLAVTASLAVLGTTWALVIGLIAGLLPALRAARVPVTVALRAT